MKKEFSFYEFVGIIVPGVTFLFFSELVIEQIYHKVIIDFSKVGESIVFVIISYGIGHILQSVGNLFELVMWKAFGSMPTQWLNQKNRFGKNLFDAEMAEKIKTKAFEQFGGNSKRDYGRDAYSWLSQIEKTTEKRIDVFNANYSLFRGLTITFYILAIIVWIYVGWKEALFPIILGFLSNLRMYRFAKLYASEIFRTYLIHKENRGLL